MTRPSFWRNPFVADPDAVKKARRKRSYGSEQTREYFESRRDAMVTLHRDGATLEEIGAVYGVTRERARQVIAGATKRGTGLDPIRTVQVCRKVSSLANARNELGAGTGPEIRRLLQQTGYWPAMNRLWKWRQSKLHGKISDEELIAKLRAFAEKLGHTPGMKEVNADPDMPRHTTYVRRWGNWAPACEAAGLRPMAAGARGHKNRDPNTGLKYYCKRGHQLTSENVYIYTDKQRGDRRVCKACLKLRDEAERQALIDAGKLKPRVRHRDRLCKPEVIVARNSMVA